MNKLSIIICFLFVSCLNLDNQGFNPHKEIQGDWLILYPQHVLKTDAQRNVYGKVQDSIVNLLGLKLVTFTSDGLFIDTDSLYGKHGVWKVADTSRLEIRSAGKGFQNFKGTVAGIINDTILIEELVRINNENIKLIWHLKKIDPSHDGGGLFKRQNNSWRQKPSKKETDKEIKERVVAMLKY